MVASIKFTPTLNLACIDFNQAKLLIKYALDLAHNKSHNLVRNLVTLLKDLISNIEMEYNIDIQIDYRKLANIYTRDLPKERTIHHKALISENGSLSQLRSNIVEIFKAINITRSSPIINDVLDVAFYTGLRISEVMNIKITDINFKEKYIHIPITKTIRDGSGFNVPISQSLKEILQRTLDDRCDNGEFLFNSNNLEKFTPNNARNSLIAFNKNINLKCIRSIDQYQSIHGIRSLMREFMQIHENKITHTTAEACLSHKTGSQIERSYNRNLLALTKNRIQAMQMWSDFLDQCKEKAKFNQDK